jgi:hypothetical protein
MTFDSRKPTIKNRSHGNIYWCIFLESISTLRCKRIEEYSFFDTVGAYHSTFRKLGKLKNIPLHGTDKRVSKNIPLHP